MRVEKNMHSIQRQLCVLQSRLLDLQGMGPLLPLLEKMYSISLCKVLCAKSQPSAKAWGRSLLLYRSKKYRTQTLSPKKGILIVLRQGLGYLQFRLRKIELNINLQRLYKENLRLSMITQLSVQEESMKTESL